MSDAPGRPGRIWAWDDRTPTERDKGWSACDAGTGSTEYIRADLVPAPSVTVKPLEWDCDFATVDIPEGYSAYDNGDGDYTVYMIWRTGSEKLNEAEFPTIEAAKAAAQADYEARIMAAIQIGPASPRSEYKP